SDLSALGGIALALVIYSVLRMLGAVEGSLNDIWGVQRSRRLVRRVSDYLAIVVVAPVFLLLATALTTVLEGEAERGPRIELVAPAGSASISPESDGSSSDLAAAERAHIPAPAAAVPHAAGAGMTKGFSFAGLSLLPLIAAWLGLSF